MKKFMVFIYPKDNSIFTLSEDDQKKHIQKVGSYLEQLKDKKFLLDAQPLKPNGTYLSGNQDKFLVATKNDLQIAGFYLIQSIDLENLISVLKEDPRFEDASWQLEIREILELM